MESYIKNKYVRSVENMGDKLGIIVLLERRLIRKNEI